jgi:flagellar motor switch protein FliN/FliY
MADKAAAESESSGQGATVTELKPVDTAAVEAQAPAEANTSRPRNLDLIMDIPLKVTVELGRAKMVVHDLLALGQGSVIELNKLAGEPMEVLVNDKLVARGEAVVVNEKFGVRLTDIISPMERIQQLK